MNIKHPIGYQIVVAIEKGEADLGILICWSAQGVAITANKKQNIRTAVCWVTEIASLARKYNDANVLCLPARFFSNKETTQIALVFLQTKFEGCRHLKRIEKIALNPV